MATLNDFKLLEQKSIHVFDMLNIEEKKTHTFTTKEKARFGFYYYVIQNFTSFPMQHTTTSVIIRQYLRGHWQLEHPTDLQKKEKTVRNEILIEAIQYGAPLRQLSD